MVSSRRWAAACRRPCAPVHSWGFPAEHAAKERPLPCPAAGRPSALVVQAQVSVAPAGWQHRTAGQGCCALLRQARRGSLTREGGQGWAACACLLTHTLRWLPTTPCLQCNPDLGRAATPRQAH